MAFFRLPHNSGKQNTFEIGSSITKAEKAWTSIRNTIQSMIRKNSKP
ncbi:hypothetical protein HOLDEFILI_00689 [Holdemania filiformis DSM 12042]|uniref:Uncharacterized protein n=1 Tax=Holdemania filiformis DSM 12042 TaxID=545696 RepID=B9Y4F8_9FIRM|nr:hypothetical protein HOLDEFILI_00689 [Holdemania filiformis DSM 12042]